ncbi:MAG: molybdopterin molybdotransferase MoeA [Chloroflexota bacterium]
MAKLTDLLPVEEARSQILARFQRLGAEAVGLDLALGRVLAEDVAAPMDVPPFANSSMDGFAVRSADTDIVEGGRSQRLAIGAHIAAGSARTVSIDAGTCARIMTGAPVPAGADAVVPFEDVSEDDGGIVLAAAVPVGSCIRPAGNDLRAGDRVLAAGTTLHAPQIALLAALGHDSARVVTRPVVAILSTGDELVPPGHPLRPGQIYNSNTPMISAAVRESGGSPMPIETARDDEEHLRDAIARAHGADLLLTTGGASVGDFDYVNKVVGQAGAVQFWRVNVRPGKPLLLGAVDGVTVIGLPGNPTSAMVTFEQFVRPAIRFMLGARTGRPEIVAILDESVDNRGGRRTYARVRLYERDGRFHATPAGSQDSAMLLPLAHADGLLEIPHDVAILQAGQEATVQVWRLPETNVAGERLDADA